MPSRDMNLIILDSWSINLELTVIFIFKNTFNKKIFIDQLKSFKFSPEKKVVEVLVLIYQKLNLKHKLMIISNNNPMILQNFK